MWDVSLEAATRWYLVSWYGQFLAAALVVVCLVVQFWSSNIREKYADAEQVKLKAGTAHATERVEELRNQNLTLETSLEKEKIERLRLEAQIAPRRITQVQQNELTATLKAADLPKQHGVIFGSPSTPESEMLARTLAAALRDAGWDIRPINGTPTATVLYPGGVVVQFATLKNNNHDMTLDAAAANTLAKYLNSIGIEATAISAVPGLTIEAGHTIRITISAK
jgi:hypothetical protein